MELEAFRTNETTTSANGETANIEMRTIGTAEHTDNESSINNIFSGDLMPKRVWRAPKKNSSYLPEDKLKK